MLAHGPPFRRCALVGRRLKVGFAENIRIAVPIMGSPEYVEAAEKATRDRNAGFLRGSQSSGKALLLRNYCANLTLLIGIIAVGTLALYAVRVAQNCSPVPALRNTAAPTEK